MRRTVVRRAAFGGCAAASVAGLVLALIGREQVAIAVDSVGLMLLALGTYVFLKSIHAGVRRAATPKGAVTRTDLDSAVVRLGEDLKQFIASESQVHAERAVATVMQAVKENATDLESADLQRAVLAINEAVEHGVAEAAAIREITPVSPPLTASSR